MNSHQPVAVVTGASSGIGAATARRLAATGWRVVLVARRLERLLELQAELGNAEVLAADLSSESERVRVFKQIRETDVLVNNAGFGWYGYFTNMPWETAREMLHVNIEAAAHLARLYLPGMIARKYGYIINVGSVSGSIPSQGIALYAATKSFMDAFTTALYRETRGTGVNVSVVRAGPVRTEFCDSAAQHGNGGHLPTERMGVSADYVAKRIERLIQHPRRVIYVPWWLRVTPWFELSFGWLEDRLGPLLLRRKEKL